MGSYIDRRNIGIFGKMNAGKSSVMNLLTQQETSIVDSTPGTTADTKVSLCELHGLGPVRIFDTPGIDEKGELGQKKKAKALNNLKESDLVLLVMDPSGKDFQPETELLDAARDLDKQILIIYNLFNSQDEEMIFFLEKEMNILKFHRKIILKANDISYRKTLTEFIVNSYEPEDLAFELLPFVERDQFYILIIPMDDETPKERFLRPQAMAEEYITRHWAYPVSYRLDLSKARSNHPEEERKRFETLVNELGKRPKCIITDSQAIDIMKDWCPADVYLTTFSIMMIQYMSNGRLKAFAEGVSHLSELKEGDSLLIVEACNHSRIGEDIGTVQIPSLVQKKFPGVIIEHNFGREFQENKNLHKYSLITHCGGCMISKQKMTARIRDIEMLGIPFTNYGIFLSAAQGENALAKVLSVWKL